MERLPGVCPGVVSTTLDEPEGVRAFLQIFPFERRHRRETPCAAAAELGAEQGGIPGGARRPERGRFMQGRHAIQVIEVEMRAQDGPEREVLFLEQGEDFAGGRCSNPRPDRRRRRPSR